MTRETAHLGQKVRALRRREKLTQSELATRLGISASYLNLIENNHRPLPSALLIRLAQMFDVELHSFAVDDESRLQAALFEALADPIFEADEVLASDVRELASPAPRPNIARACLGLANVGVPAKIVAALRGAGPDDIVWLGRPPTRIDLLQSLPALNFADAWPRRLIIELSGVSIPVLGKDDLIRNNGP